MRVFHPPPTQVGHAGVSVSRHSASAELLVVYCRFLIIVDVYVCTALTGRPPLKSKERSSEVLTGQTGAILLTATTSDARSAQRK